MPEQHKIANKQVIWSKKVANLPESDLEDTGLGLSCTGKGNCEDGVNSDGGNLLLSSRDKIACVVKQ